nr:ATP-binding protein [Saccharopolyspora sp. HNM0983]
MRRSVLRAWQESPTRFREDVNAEQDLRRGGYRDRLAVELAQNAADAAGADGVLQVRTEDGQLRVANTGAPLTAAGVAALSSLRASAKRDGTSVGRFGVGFAAVLAVSDDPAVLSTGGGVRFSARWTEQEAAQLPGPAADESAGGAVPVLRLPWPDEQQPPAGFATEVRLPLRAGIEPDEVLAEFAEQAADLLLALPALREIRVGAESWTRSDDGSDRVAVHGPSGSRRWLVHRESGALAEGVLAELVPESGHAHWRVCWALPLGPGGEPEPGGPDVLHAPTPTEERLSLPARLLATVPLEPDRRRVAAVPATDAVLTHAAECYPQLVGKLPAEQRTSLVPLPGFPLSDVDDKLRQAVGDRLRVVSWLPRAAGGAVDPVEARVLDPVSPDLVELLADVVDGLLPAEFSEPRHRAALQALEVPRLDLADVVAAVSGLRRDPDWWHRLYAGLEPIEAADPHAREEFTALPVPLADGRTVSGVPGVLLCRPDDPATALSELDVSGLRIAHPAATHPLLERLGAHPAGAHELLDAPALADAVRSSAADAHAGMDVRPLARAVLRLVTRGSAPEWLGALALPATGGSARRADELVLPGSELLQVLDTAEVGPDGALGVLDPEFAAEHDAELLRAVGVLDGFAVHVEEEPTAADEDFPGARQWWAERVAADPDGAVPGRFTALRDLDLVADDCWPAALRLISRDPDGWRALREPGGYPSWWIARFALLAGHPPAHWRLPGAAEPEGLHDPVPELGLDEQVLRAAGVRERLSVGGTADAADLLSRLGDRDREVPAGTALRAHRVLAEAVAGGAVDPAEVDPPQLVRSLTGAVVPAERAVVLDEPWMLGVLESAFVVAGGGPEDTDPEALAELLDLPLASEEDVPAVPDTGSARPWRDVARVPAAARLLGITVPDGQVVLHEELHLQLRSGAQRVHWWVEPDGRVHAERTPDGLARALAWAVQRWSERFALAALLADPGAPTLLR